MDDKELISLDDAIKRLPAGETVHTFRQGGPCLIGADHERDRLIKAMRNAPEIEVTGPQAQAMNHGLAIRDEHGWLFIETANAKVSRSAPLYGAASLSTDGLCDEDRT